VYAGIWSVPSYLYFYAFGGYREWMSYSWCFAYNSLTEFIPAAFHTASIWLTVTLAVQRYIYVYHNNNNNSYYYYYYHYYTASSRRI